MIQILYFALLLVTFFLAGMFSYLPLLVLFLAMLIMTAFCLVTSRYFRRHLTARFRRHSETAMADQEITCELVLSYTGRLPTGEVRVLLHSQYARDRRRKRRLTLLRRSVEEKGDRSVPFPVKAPYCGLASISFDRLMICDYLTLFRPLKKVKDSMELAVFPAEKALQMEFSLRGDEKTVQPETQLQERPGNDSQEIRQLREYQEGDAMRQIHWNLSARMDDLWVKEFQRESDSMAYVMLDGRGFSACHAAEASCFYELVSALVLGLLAHVSAVTLGWQEPEIKGMHLQEIQDADQCRETLLMLYRSGLSEELPPGLTEQEGLFLVDPSLRISRNGQILHQFSRKTLQEELDREILLL